MGGELVLDTARSADVAGHCLQAHRAAADSGGQPQRAGLLLDVHCALGRGREHARQPSAAVAQHAFLTQVHAQGPRAGSDHAAASADEALGLQTDVATGLKMRPGPCARDLQRTEGRQPQGAGGAQATQFQRTDRAFANDQVAFGTQHHIAIAVRHHRSRGLNVEVIHHAQGHTQEVAPVFDPLALDHIAHPVDRPEQGQVLRPLIRQLDRTPQGGVRKSATGGQIDRGIVAKVDVALVLQRHDVASRSLREQRFVRLGQAVEVVRVDDGHPVAGPAHSGRHIGRSLGQQGDVGTPDVELLGRGGGRGTDHVRMRQHGRHQIGRQGVTGLLGTCKAAPGQLLLGRGGVGNIALEERIDDGTGLGLQRDVTAGIHRNAAGPGGGSEQAHVAGRLDQIDTAVCTRGQATRARGCAVHAGQHQPAAAVDLHRRTHDARGRGCALNTA